MASKIVKNALSIEQQIAELEALKASLLQKQQEAKVERTAELDTMLGKVHLDFGLPDFKTFAAVVAMFAKHGTSAPAGKMPGAGNGDGRGRKKLSVDLLKYSTTDVVPPDLAVLAKARIAKGESMDDIYEQTGIGRAVLMEYKRKAKEAADLAAKERTKELLAANASKPVVAPPPAVNVAAPVGKK